MSPCLNLSEFLNYLANTAKSDSGGDNANTLPPINKISTELGISVASLREQLEVAKALGLVEVRPRTGIRRLPYSFSPAVCRSLSYALAVDQTNFEAYSDLRNHIEESYWHEAVLTLNKSDEERLKQLMNNAWEKLKGNPIQIPHQEHRQLHLLIYHRLDNIFVQGILSTYWDAYEAVGMNVFADYNYLQTVWNYHQTMVDAICSKDYNTGYQALVEHKELLFHRPH